jgi:hypothetical protein
MVHIVHPTVFSLPDGTDPASCGGCLPFLELNAEFFVMSPFLFDHRSGIKGSLLSVTGNSEETDAPVDANDFFAAHKNRSHNEIRYGCVMFL